MAFINYHPDNWDTLFTSEELWLIESLFRGVDRKIRFAKEDQEITLLDYASRNGVGQLLYRNVASNRLSEKGRMHLRQEYLSGLGRNTAFQLIADEIVSKFSSEGIDIILLKGSFLSRFVYAEPALRPMSDIDILVPAESAEKAWRMIGGDKPLTGRDQDSWSHHLPSVLYRGASIEIHHSLFVSNIRYSIPSDLIWRRSENIQGSQFRVLNPVHQIIYLALHCYYTYRQGGLRLSWLMDITKLLEYYPNRIIKEKVVQEMRILHVYKPVSIILALHTILNPGSSLQFPVESWMTNHLKKMILFLRESGSRGLEYSYTLAWERLWYMKGIFPKLRLAKELVLFDSTGHKLPIIKRLWHLLCNTSKMVRRKIRQA